MKLVLFFLFAIFASTRAANRFPCGPDESCPTGMICATKPSGLQRCITPMKQGGHCKRDAFWICEEGLDCINGTCTEIVPKNGSCVSPFTKCADGLVCAEKSPTRKKCIMPMPLGAPCKRDAFWRCEDGLVCSNGFCQGRVLSQRVGRIGQTKVAKEGESCVDPNRVCGEGLVCFDKGAAGKGCIRPKKAGDVCEGYPYSYYTCGPGLICLYGTCELE